MIDGVIIKNLKVHTDIPDSKKHAGIKSGMLIEVLRKDGKLLKKFGQTVFTVSYKGAIKGFHWHKKQDDIWFVASGKAKIVLYDRRKRSKSFGQTDVISAGVDDYKLIVIPKGVAHGYQVLSDDPVLLFYHVTEVYDKDNPDEQRIPYNDQKIGFDWSV